MPIRFQVDPDFYDHPKSLGLSDAATALWVRAGSYSAAKLTDGFIAEHVLVLLSQSPSEASDELRRRGLWQRVKGGYRFHEWDHRNLTKKRVEDDRATDRARKRNARGNGTQSAGQNGNPQAKAEIVRPESERNPEGFQAESDRIPGVSVSVSVSESVSGSGRGGGGSETAAASLGPKPPSTCRDHRDDPDPPACRRCKEARESGDRWEAERGRRVRESPQCQKHPGSLAHNCGGCRADRLAGDQ